MMKFRIKEIGTVLAEEELRALFSSMSLPEVIGAECCEILGVEAVRHAEPPAVKRWQRAEPAEPVQNENGEWQEAYAISEIDVDLAAWKRELTQQASEHRYAVETGGITLQSGMQIKTDRESQAATSAVYSSLKDGLIPNTEWLSASGEWLTVTASELEPIAKAVAQHVRACRIAEKQHHELIALIDTKEDADAYSVLSGWPSDVLV